jgi:hypothetical protein
MMTNGNGMGIPEPGESPGPEHNGRRFTCDGGEWIAWPSGASAYGTGTLGPAALEAVHFARGEQPDTPAFEALIPAGSFFGLFDEELIRILRGATKVVDASERPLKAATRRGEGLL